MVQERVQRRLAAVVAADVVGYSRLIGEDEEGTLARLRDLRTTLIDPKIAEHGGRIVKTMGDGILIEFDSAVAAVCNAVEVQQAIQRRNADLPAAHRLEFRVGVNIGDIIVEGDDILGDGVNIAARLESIAEPAGVCISQAVFDQVVGKLDSHFEDIGEPILKNIDRPVRVYRLVQDQAQDAVPALPGTGESQTIPDRPSIAVLPFVNMSGDPDQEYFSDGISEDIITALSSVRWFFVIARNSSFAYKDNSPDMRAVAAQLGVAYLLEGSVRKAGNRVRISAQLIEGATGHHVWAKRYDRELEDVFAIQDEITETIVGAIEPEMARAERERAKSKQPGNLHAWDLFQRGMWHTYHRTGHDLEEAQRLFALARDADPQLSPAHAGAAEAYFFQTVGGFAASIEDNKANAIRLGRRAVELDGKDAFAHYALGRALTLARQPDGAIAELETAIELNPSFAQAHFALGFVFSHFGRAEEAVDHFHSAMRLSPQDPYFGQFLIHLSSAMLYQGRYDEAVDYARQSLRQPNIQWSRWVYLAAALGHAGKAEEARQGIDSLQRLAPDFRLELVGQSWPHDTQSWNCVLDGLKKAGVTP